VLSGPQGRLAPVTPGIDDDLALALRLADKADEISRAAFTGDAVAHDLKADGSPVSAADVAVERAICEILARERPDDGVLGEEVGPLGATGRRWILDGIDGTVLFVAGRVGWATEIALEVDGQVVVGVCTSPVHRRRYWAARGRGAWRRDSSVEATRVRVSEAATLDGGRYSAIPPLEALDGGRRAVAERLGTAGAAWVPPSEHGALFVADGRVDACVQLGGGPWDFAALAVIVSEAGGSYSDMTGDPDIYGGGPALFSNGRVHRAALAALSGRESVNEG
jgi:histidinol-phosphatase